MRYAAFLRGVNVGGQKPLRMADLRAAFERMGFGNVRTVLTSGNVVFDITQQAAEEEDFADLGARIESDLGRVLGFPITVALRRVADLQRLVASDPFRSVAITPDTRLYVTFLSRPVMARAGVISERQEADLKLVQITPGEVFSAITLSPGWGTSELMALLEKEFGPGVTTRNWNTITKIGGI
jgi:uncharacterized protein (DUF1697 family)